VHHGCCTAAVVPLECDVCTAVFVCGLLTAGDVLCDKGGGGPETPASGATAVLMLLLHLVCTVFTSGFVGWLLLLLVVGCRLVGVVDVGCWHVGVDVCMLVHMSCTQFLPSAVLCWLLELRVALDSK
jgi:hypothetical protein